MSTLPVHESEILMKAVAERGEPHKMLGRPGFSFFRSIFHIMTYIKWNAAKCRCVCVSRLARAWPRRHEEHALCRKGVNTNIVSCSIWKPCFYQHPTLCLLSCVAGTNFTTRANLTKASVNVWFHFVVTPIRIFIFLIWSANICIILSMYSIRRGDFYG